LQPSLGDDDSFSCSFHLTHLPDAEIGEAAHSEKLEVFPRVERRVLAVIGFGSLQYSSRGSSRSSSSRSAGGGGG
jgi:hypothetical protein